MTNMTLTEKNFGKKMASLYEKVRESGDVHITITQIESNSSVQKVKKSALYQAIHDPDNTSYGPFTVDEFVREMKNW